MISANALIDWLARGPTHGGASVTGWRVEIAETEGLRVGVHASRLGGPYEAPGIVMRAGGSIVLAWSDGQATRARLDRAEIQAPEDALAVWRASASAERRAPVFAPPAAAPSVQIYDDALASAITGDPAALLRLLADVQGVTVAAGIRRLDATLRASRGHRLVATSGGCCQTWHETAIGLDIWLDEVADAVFGRRRLPRDTEVRALLDNAIAGARLPRGIDARSLRAGGVLFMPSAVEALLSRFFLSALSGRAILDGRSPFSREDLANSRAILRPDLDLTVDTTLPFELATAPFSADGVPAGRVALIEAGRLAAPILDLVTAREIGMPPTPSPRGRPLLLLSSRRDYLELDDALMLLGDGVALRELPGLHTQSTHRWSYALVVPDAQAVQAGKLTGWAPARVRGNLLEHLRSESTRLVRVPGEINPALLVLDGITIEPA